MAIENTEIDTTIETPAPPPLNERPADGPGSGRGALRQQLEKSVEGERKGREAREAKEPKEPKRQARTAAPNHQEPEEVIEEPEVPELEAPEVQEVPPEAFTKEAKAEWAQTPANVRAAILKREEDMAKGVDSLKKGYAEIDQALAPRLDVIKKNGHTPGQAVNQLFAWFEALQANPKQAFPALAQSFRFDLRALLPQATAPVPGQQQPGTTPPEQQPEIPPAVQAYISGLERKLEERLGGLNQHFTQQLTQQSMAKTQEILDSWSKDKAHFETVRNMMSHLIGSGAVPPLPNGAADLDKAYDMAVFALPEVRAKVLAEQEQARVAALKEKREKERLAQQEQADRARKAAAGTLRSGAPGEPTVPGKKKGAGKSVRESLMEAREELSSTT